MNVRSVLISLFLAVIFFIIGIFAGMFFAGSKTATVLPTQTQALPESIKVLSSKVVPAITARGKVTKVSGNNVTLSYQSDTATITMRTDVNVYALVPAVKTATQKSNYVSRQMAFKDIKVGDNLEVGVKVLTTGKLEGFNILILPAVTPVVAPTPVKK